MRIWTVLIGLAVGCGGAGAATREAAAPVDPRTIRDTSGVACAGAASGAQCLVLQVAGMDTLLVPEGAEVEQVPGSTEVRVTIDGADPSTGIAWRADGRNLLLAALGRPARVAIVAPKRMLIARRTWLSGDRGEAIAEQGNGLANGWTRLGVATTATDAAPLTPQSNDASGATEVPAGGEPPIDGPPQQDVTGGDQPEDVQTGDRPAGDEQTEGTEPPPAPVAPPAGY